MANNICCLVKIADKKVNYLPGMHIQIDSASALPVDYDISPLTIVKFSNFKNLILNLINLVSPMTKTSDMLLNC